MTDLSGKIAIVTGTSSGVGLSIAHELLKEGATVVGCARTPLDAIPGTEDHPDWISRSAQIVCDQGDYTAIDAMVQQVADRYGRIDILVNNAGGAIASPSVHDVPELVAQFGGTPASDDSFERTALYHAYIVQMNLTSPLWFAIRVYRQMAKQDGTGCIINISSGASHPAGSPTLVSYGAGKAGLNHFTRSLAQEWGPKARVNCIALGPIVTDNFRAFVLSESDPDGAKFFKDIPLVRGGEPIEVARTCVFLASGEADYINGTTIQIDGGMLPGVLYGPGLKTITDMLN